MHNNSLNVSSSISVTLQLVRDFHLSVKTLLDCCLLLLFSLCQSLAQCFPDCVSRNYLCFKSVSTIEKVWKVSDLINMFVGVNANNMKFSVWLD